jgi:hypothetical protein
LGLAGEGDDVFYSYENRFKLMPGFELLEEAEHNAGVCRLNAESHGIATGLFHQLQVFIVQGFYTQPVDA